VLYLWQESGKKSLLIDLDPPLGDTALINEEHITKARAMPPGRHVACRTIRKKKLFGLFG
jgi:hypothetical protein